MRTLHLTMRDLAKRKVAGMFDLAKYEEILGEDTPSVALNKIGRFRLLQLLRRKFGASFKNVGQAQRILKDFDTQMKVSGAK